MTQPTIRFDGQVAVVTGAGNGLGRAYALALAARGAKVVVNDLGGSVAGAGGSSTAADAVVAEIKAAGGEAVANYASVSDKAGAKSIIDTAVSTFGTVDIVINNAGILRDKSFAKMELADFELVVGVHLLGAAYVTHAAWPLLREKGYGRVLMTTSSAGLYGNFGQANYAAAKLGLVGLAKSLALEGGKAGIKVNAIAPVAVTRLSEGVMPPGAAEKLSPEAVTPAVLYLASKECAVTGQVIVAGAGHFYRSETVESVGTVLGADALTPEAFADALPKVTDLTGATPFPGGAMEAVARVFG
jgi:NAD(P)-dependent dehydrogenase (short-subunit alcohol dehydrogenase family)